MKNIETIYLFIHAPAKRPRRSGLVKAVEIEERWLMFVKEHGADDSAAVCVIQGGFGGDPELVEVAGAAFGDRCVVDPDDHGVATKQILADDLDRCFQGRGSHGEWNIYEIWSSNNARRWAEGLKAELDGRGYSYDPGSVCVETFGNWTGCHHKYTNFMTRYLGAADPAHAHATKDMCALKDMPMPPAALIEEIEMDRGVMLYVFRSEMGAPMAQYWDGLRAVWEPPHLAHVSIDPKRAMLYTFSPNAYIPVDGAGSASGDRVIMDVGDGAHPAYSTLVGENRSTREPVDMAEFVRVCSAATISEWDRSVSVYYRVEV